MFYKFLSALKWSLLLNVSSSPIFKGSISFFGFLLPLIHSLLPKREDCINLDSVSVPCHTRNLFGDTIAGREFLASFAGVLGIIFLYIMIRICAPAFARKYPNWAKFDKQAPSLGDQASELFLHHPKELPKSKTQRGLETYFKTIESPKIASKLKAIDAEQWTEKVASLLASTTVPNEKRSDGYQKIIQVADFTFPYRRLFLFILFSLCTFFVFWPALKRFWDFLVLLIGAK